MADKQYGTLVTDTQLTCMETCALSLNFVLPLFATTAPQIHSQLELGCEFTSQQLALPNENQTATNRKKKEMRTAVNLNSLVSMHS